MAFNYSPKIVTDGLVLCLDAGNPNSYTGSGNTWKDLSRGRNNGTLVNGPTFDSGNGGSLVFDGANDYINLQDSLLWNSFQDSITLEVVFRLEGSVSNYPRIFAKQFSGLTTAQSCFQLGIYNNSDFRFAIVTSNGNKDSGVLVSNKGAASQNIIYHYTGTYNGSEMVAYVNGQPIFTIPQTGNILTSTQPLTIGTSYYNNSIQYDFPGKIYTSQIYNRALTPQEILQNYNATKSRFGL